MSDTVTEKDNYLRYIIFFIDVGRDTLLKVFTYIDTIEPGKVIFPLSECELFEKKIRKKFPPHLHRTILEAKSPADFDISILSKLLCNVFTYTIPKELKKDVEDLRKIRNDYLAHPTKARFSNAAFEQLWKEAEMIFKNITDEVDPGTKTTLAATIEEYKNQPIDTTKAREYIRFFENQIEALKQELIDFTMLCKDIQTPFFQYVKFLLNCGSTMLSAYLCQLLEKQNLSLERLLHDNHALMLRELPEWMTQQLYSESEDTIYVNTDTKSWDLSVLAKVIEVIFAKDIEEYDLTAIISIRKARENYAYTATYAITKDDRFNREREDLVTSLSTLAMHTGQGSYQEFKRFLEEYRSSSEMDTDTKEYFAKLKCHGPGIKDIRDLHRESVETSKAETGITVLVKEKLELEVMLQIACEDSSKQVEAESFVQSILESTIANANSTPKGPDLPEVRATIRKINNIQTVRVTGVQKSCILIIIECRSDQGLLSLIDFIDGFEFLDQLHLISLELKDHFEDLFILDGHFTLDSLVKTLRRKEVKDFGNDHETIYERQQDDRKSQKIGIPLESRNREDPNISKLEAVIRNLDKELKTASKRMKELQQENSTLRMKTIELNKECTVAKEEIADIKHIAEQNAESLRRRKCKVYELLTDYESPSNHKLQIEERKLAFFANQLDIEEHDKSPINNEHDLKEENTQLNERLNNLKKVYTQLGIVKQMLKEINKRMNDRLSALKEEIPRKELEMNRRERNQSYNLRRDKIHLTIHKDDLKERNSILTNQISKLETDKIRLTNQISRLEAEVGEAGKKEQLQTNDLQKLLEKSEKERERIERNLLETREDNFELSTKLSELKIKMSEAEEKYQERLSKS